MVRRESAAVFAVPYFKSLVEEAIAHQHVAAAELTSFYVVQLLAGFLQRSPNGAEAGGEPLALQLAEALDKGGIQQRVGLKQIGDLSLFIAGYFSDSLRRKLVDVDYYAAIGGYAYNALSRDESDTFAPVFAELSEKFVAFVDVINEVSERTSLTSNADLLRLYEKWLKTRSRRSGQLLAERGVVPNASIKHRIQ
jgi:hypothetical protein